MIDTIPNTQPATDRQRREALYHAFEEHVDPKTYDGCDACLIDQTAGAIIPGDDYPTDGNDEYLAARFGVDAGPLRRIYGDVCDRPYRHDYLAAMQMAKERLGLTP